MNIYLSCEFNLSLQKVEQLFSTALFYQIPICMYEFDIRYEVRDIFVVCYFVTQLRRKTLSSFISHTMQNKMNSQFTEF